MMHGNRRICMCPNCHAEWERNTDGIWEYEEYPFTHSWDERLYGDPIPDGQHYCPACAESTADAVDRLGFVKIEGLEHDFLQWLLSDAPESDVKEIFATLTANTPELMETRIEEFVVDQARDEFIQWRCGS